MSSEMKSQSPEAQNEPKDAEWTVVPRGKRRNEKPSPKPPGVDRDMDLHKLTGIYEHRMRIWKASTCRRQIQQILDHKQPEDGWQIKRAVCFASGSFCRDNWECQRRSMTQFVAFMDIVKYLQATSDDTIKIVAQEPVYTPLDVEFLSHMNVTAYTAVDINHLTSQTSAKDLPGCVSFLFEPFMDKILPAVRQLLAANPKLLIGTALPAAGATKTSVEQYSEMRLLYERFDTEYSSYHFPTFDEDRNVFEGLRISWREPKDND